MFNLLKELTVELVHLVMEVCIPLMMPSVTDFIVKAIPSKWSAGMSIECSAGPSSVVRQVFVFSLT